MANEMTKVLDVITPEQYTKYTNYQAEQHSAFIQSGIMVDAPTLNTMIENGGKMVHMPEWNKTALSDQVLVDDEALETGKVSASAQVAPVLYRGTGASYTDLAAIFAGSNPTTQILNDFADYTLESDQVVMQSIMKGLFAKGTGKSKGVLSESHVLDKSEDAKPVISPEMVIDARSILGTSRSKLRLIAMHSKVKAELEKQNVQTKHFIPASESRSGFDEYLGMAVVEDDSLVADDKGVYETFMYASGSIGRNTATPSDMVTFETDRDKSKGNNMLYVRRARVMHPMGLSYVGDIQSDSTPTNAELETPSNWKKVREDKKIGIICIRHKISADIKDVTPGEAGE